MKKVFVLILCVTAWGAALFAQEGGAEVSLLNVGNYSNFFLNGNGLLSRTYIRAADENDLNRVSALNGDREIVDTPLEIALLSTCAGIVDIRPVEAVKMLGTAREADLKLGAAAYMDMQAARFLGSDPAPYAAALKFITDRGRVTEADIKSFVKQGIAAAVDAEFNTVLFMLDGANKSYDVTLTQNPNRSYTIRYESDNIDETFTKPNLDVLLDELKKRGFTSGNCNTVRGQSTLFPALSHIDGVTDNNTVDLIKYLLTDFYTTNNQTTRLNAYKALLAIYNRYNNVLLTNIDGVRNARRSLTGAIAMLNPELSKIFENDADR